MEEALVAKQRMSQLAEETGMPFEELVSLWAGETETQLASASAALAAGNLEEAARLVHSASGSSSICGVTTLAEELKSAEKLAAAGRGEDARQALANAHRRFTAISGALHNGLNR
jgi:HPt (histidine-containing phosphotransfer) domain-containing protein